MFDFHPDTTCEEAVRWVLQEHGLEAQDMETTEMTEHLEALDFNFEQKEIIQALARTAT